jgi:hypothetical protein
MTDTIKPVSVPYDPAECIGEYGHLWFRPESYSEPEWVLIRTIEDEDDELAFLALHTDCMPDDADVYDASLYIGTAYIPASAPACGPTAGAMIRVYLPGGGVMTFHRSRRDAEAKAMTDSVIALLTGGEDDRS